MRWRLKLPASRLFSQPFIQAQIKENIKALCHWPLGGEIPGDRWIPAQMPSNAENVSILMTSSWPGPMMTKFCYLISREHSGYGLGQRETTLHCSTVSHCNWLEPWSYVFLEKKKCNDLSHYRYQATAQPNVDLLSIGPRRTDSSGIWNIMPDFPVKKILLETVLFCFNRLKQTTGKSSNIAIIAGSPANIWPIWPRRHGVNGNNNSFQNWPEQIDVGRHCIK